MNKSKLLLVLPFVLGSVLLIAFHFTLPAAAASGAIDVNTTADESGTGAACSLREAIQSANTNSDFGGCTRNGTAPYTINLPGNTYTLSGAGDENFNATGDLDIWASLTISGTTSATTIIQAGTTTGNGVDRVINITASGIDVTLSGVTVRHGRLTTAGVGGGIFHEGTGALTIVDSVVTLNRVLGNGFGGGGIACNKGALNIQNSTVSGNAATGSSDGNAGGIYNEKCTLNITGNSLIGGATPNTAKYGAGIFNVQGGAVTIDNSTVSGNVAEVNGGGILNSDAGSTVTITNGSLVGGSNGNAADWGAGIFNVQTGTITIDSSIISGNAAVEEGGGIWNSDDGSMVNISSATISSNTARSGAGVASVFGAILTVESTTVSSNTATADGGGIIGNNSVITISNGSTIGGANGNRAGNYGGGVYVGDANLTIDNSTVSGNTAGEGGGGIHNGGSNGIATIRNGSLIGGAMPNVANVGGGVYADANALVVAQDSTIMSNTATFHGGGFSILDARLIVDSSAVQGNTATVVGGAISNNGLSSFIVITNSSTIGGASANVSQYGGGIYNGGGVVTVTNSTISNNQATIDGGGIHNDEGGTTTIDRSTISGNTATGNGGGITVQWEAVTHLVNSTVSGNQAQGDGGGIHTVVTATTTLTNVTVTNNRADSDGDSNGDGGGIYQDGSLGTVVSVVNSIIAGNSSGAADSSPDCFGAFDSHGHNLIGNNANCTGFSGGVDGDFVGSAGSPIDPILGALSDNGGPTWTHALLAESAAIDAGDNAVCQSAAVNGVDQRGYVRPNPVSASCDIGAFESALTPEFQVRLPLVLRTSNE